MEEARGVQEALIDLGGVATWGELLDRCGDGPLRRAIAEEQIAKVGRGRYVATQTKEHLSRRTP